MKGKMMTGRIYKVLRLTVVHTVLVFLGGCVVRSPIHPVAAKLNTQAAKALDAGKPEKARARLLVALEYNPCYPGALHNLALVEFMDGALDKAEQLEQRALDCQQDLVQAINGLGVIYRARGNLELAEEWFEHALEVDPGCLDARRNLVDTLQLDGKISEAQKERRRLEVLEATR